ncbi:hypothetical protein PQ459_10420 [Chryseobacterium sp. KACC 21268]|nr:hypothetical protein PQ459_10420 [Chryseobacterium sp. KACC 21268]
MKNLFFFVAVLWASFTFAQAPNLMSYQAVVRNSSNALVVNQSVGVKFSILKTSVSGTVIYSETHTKSTNSNGLVSAELGNGTVVSGSLSTIDWGADKYFVKTDIDPSGGTSYSISGTQQLLSVPYALNAKNGLPAGGTAGQVLTKINNLDNSSQWTTPNFSSAKLELMVTKNTTQALVASTSPTPDQVTYENVLTSPTVGSYTNNAYTVGTNGAGLYLIQTRNSMIDNATPSNTLGAYNFLEVNASAYGSYNNIYPSYISNVSQRAVTNVVTHSSSQYMFLVYLNAGDVIRIRATSANSAILQSLSNDGGTQLMIVKL